MKPCKIFEGYIAKNGYGHLYNPRTKKKDSAHRVVYERAYGLIPDGHELDHLCEVKACVEPTHLEPVPHYVNCLRGRATKLTSQQVREIRASKQSSRQIASRYGVHDSTIRKIRRYERFKQLLLPVEERIGA